MRNLELRALDRDLDFYHARLMVGLRRTGDVELSTE